MDYDLYTPPSDLGDRQEIQGEIDFIHTVVATLDPKSPQYEEAMAHYYGQLDNMNRQLRQCSTVATPAPSYPVAMGTSNYQMPNEVSSYSKPNGGPSYSTQNGGSNYSVSNGKFSSNLQPHSNASQRRSELSFPGYATSSLPVRSQQHDSWNTQLQVPIQSSNFIDLTQDDDDPFIETKDAFMPGVQPSFDISNQTFMNNDQLANYLWDPAAPKMEIPALQTVRPFSSQLNGLNPQQDYNRVNHLMEDSHSTQLSSLMGVGGATTWGNPVPETDYDYLFGGHVPAPDEPEAVQDLIENIKFDQEVRPDQRKPTPVAMKSTLMEHQKIALTWLLMMERNNTKGGILADEMGLGKTVQALALILANPSEDPACKTTLIIAPVALMRQWEKEIERHVKPHHRLKVFVCHNEGPRKKPWSSLRNYDVVLTTYGTLASQYKRKTNRLKQQEQEKKQQELDQEQQGGDGGPKKRRRITEYLEPDLGLVGRDCMWYRVILDEAQCIKNRDTWSSKAADDLQSRYRLAMTGTPMMNSVDELYSLVRFLKIPPYNSWAKFRMDVSTPLKKSDHMRQQAMQRVQALLKSIMLRRCKTTLVDGKEICQIPPKETLIQHVEFSDEEMSLYKAIETKSQLQFNKYLAKGTVNNNYANVLVMLLRLRQICCHPHLVKDLGVQASTENISGEELEDRAGMLSAEVVNRLRNCADEGFECPICYETVVNPTIFIPCGHTCCGECFQKLIDPSRAIQQGMETSEARCPECRNALSSKEITDFMHFCRVHMPELLDDLDLQDNSETDNGSEDDSDEESDGEESGDDVDKNGNLKNFVVDTEDDEEYLDDELTSGKDEEEDVKPAKSQREDKGKGKAKAKKPKVTLAQLKKDSLRNKDAKRRYLKRLRKQFQTSAKIEKTMELLSEINAKDPTEKTLVFSQFTSLLDLLEVPLQERKVKYQRYDGSMSMNDRADAVNQFMDNASETVFLISLKAGNAGLNLNKASQVIILDPFWNPFVEDQAVDRAHRMPQQREVKVHRVLVPETVEDRICALQDKKRDLINTAMDEGVGKQLTRLSVGELRYLFGLSPH